LESNDLGRWPANVLLDEEAAALLDEQTGELTAAAPREHAARANLRAWRRAYELRAIRAVAASRFYYVAKPSREERDYGTEGLDRPPARREPQGRQSRRRQPEGIAGCSRAAISIRRSSPSS
jgi:hypothetical protein